MNDRGDGPMKGARGKIGCAVDGCTNPTVGANAVCSRHRQPDTATVDRQALLDVVRRLDLDAAMPVARFNASFDKLRAAFTPDEVASGKLR